MATVKGQNLRVFVGELPIAAALECDLSVQLNTKTFSTKDDEGDFDQLMTVSLAWSIKAQAVVTDIDYVQAVGANDIMGLIGEQVNVQLNTTSGDQNRTADETLLAGQAILSDVQITAQKRQRTVYDVTLTGVKDMLIDLRTIITADGHSIVTADGNTVIAPHDPNADES